MSDESNEKSPADLSLVGLWGLLGRLKPGELYGLIGAIATVLGAVYMLGSAIANTVAVARDPVEVFGRDSQEQQVLRQRPSLVAFQEFLDAAAESRWVDAYGLLSGRAQQHIGAPERLAWLFRMTHRHEFHYFIPTDVKPGQEKYDAEFSYWDYFPQLLFRDAFIKQPLRTVLNSGDVAKISDEIYEQLVIAYEPPADGADSIRAKVQGRVADTMTLRDLVRRDDIIEDMGRIFDLQPIGAESLTGAYQGAAPPTERRRMFHIELMEEGGKWKVEFYQPYLVERQ